MAGGVRIITEFHPEPLLAKVKGAWGEATVAATAIAVEKAPTNKSPNARKGRVPLKHTIFGREVGHLHSMIWSTSGHARYVEFDTAPHVIEPRTAKVLHFIGSSGDDVFASIVKHPGTTAQPFLRPAAAAFPALFNRIARGMLA